METIGNILWWIGLIGWLIVIIIPFIKYKFNFHDSVININIPLMWLFLIILWIGVFLI